MYVVVFFCICEISLFNFFKEMVLILLVVFIIVRVLDVNNIVVSFYLDEFVLEKLFLFLWMCRKILCLKVIVYLGK